MPFKHSLCQAILFPISKSTLERFCLQLSYVIRGRAKKAGLKIAFFSPIFCSFFGQKPLYVVVYTLFFLFKPQYVIIITASTWVVCGKQPSCCGICYNGLISCRINIRTISSFSILLLFHTLSRFLTAVLRQVSFLP